MEGKFVIKFDKKEDFLKGSTQFMQLLNTWKENAEKYKRDYDLVATQDEDANAYRLEVSVSVEKN